VSHDVAISIRIYHHNSPLRTTNNLPVPTISKLPMGGSVASKWTSRESRWLFPSLAESETHASKDNPDGDGVLLANARKSSEAKRRLITTCSTPHDEPADALV